MVKGVGQAAINILLEERQNGGKFTSLLDLCQRIDLKKLNRKTLETLIRCGAFDFIEANRGGLFAAVPQAIKLAEQHHQNQKHHQGDMFGLFGGQDTNTAAVLNITDDAAWPPREQLEYEKETLGLFLSDHPVNAVRDLLQQICTHGLGGLGEEMATWTRPQRRNDAIPLRIGGLITEVRKMTSKKGNPMAFVTLDDRSGRFEIGVFGDLVTKSDDLLRPDNIIIVDAKADFTHYKEEWRIAAEHIYNIEDARYAMLRHLIIHCDDRFTQWADLHNLLQNKRCGEEEGGSGLNLIFTAVDAAARADIHIPGRFHFDAEHIAQLNTWFGHEQIRYQYH